MNFLSTINSKIPCTELGSFGQMRGARIFNFGVEIVSFPDLTLNIFFDLAKKGKKKKEEKDSRSILVSGSKRVDS